jgi:hypothetical protein
MTPTERLGRDGEPLEQAVESVFFLGGDLHGLIDPGGGARIHL